MNELVAKINEAFEAFAKDAALQVEKGNKAAGTRARKASLVFDALHQYEPVRDEIAWAKGIGVACICGHDYNNPSPVFGVTRAVDEAFPHGVDVCGMCWKGK